MRVYVVIRWEFDYAVDCVGVYKNLDVAQKEVLSFGARLVEEDEEAPVNMGVTNHLYMRDDDGTTYAIHEMKVDTSSLPESS